MQINDALRFWIPMVQLKPLASFPKRFVVKLVFLVRRMNILLLRKLRVSGTRVIGQSTSGNVILTNHRTNALGNKRARIHVPKDKVIFEHLRLFGQWELAESIFLAAGLKGLKMRPIRNGAFLDIGANTGLITLQTMNLARTGHDAILVEPIPRHVDAIRNNLENTVVKGKVRIFQFGLSDEDKSEDIFSEGNNFGNSSILESVIPPGSKIRTQIELRKTSSFVLQELQSYDGFVIKCDTQGFDAKILSQLTASIWNSTEAAVVEVWALKEIDPTDVTRCIELWKHFTNVSWSSSIRENIGFEEVYDFWTARNNASRNLFLSKSF
jgi:FkbM family methyltransferase